MGVELVYHLHVLIKIILQLLQEHVVLVHYIQYNHTISYEYDIHCDYIDYEVSLSKRKFSPREKIYQ